MKGKETATPEFHAAIDAAAKIVTLNFFGVTPEVAMEGANVAGKELWFRPSEFVCAVTRESRPLKPFERAMTGWCGPIARVLIAMYPQLGESYEFRPGEIVVECGGLSADEKQAIRAQKGFRETFQATVELVEANKSEIRELAQRWLAERNVEAFRFLPHEEPPSV